jgi:hypothetical protein
LKDRSIKRKHCPANSGDRFASLYKQVATNQASWAAGAPPTRPISHAAAAANKNPTVDFHQETRTAASILRAQNFFCTIDLYRAEETTEEAKNPAMIRSGIKKSIGEEEGGEKTWRCVAVIRDRRHPQRIKIICKDETELKVKKAAEATLPKGSRILRDQLYPIKVDSGRTDAVLQPNGKPRADVRETLEAENNTSIAKAAWLSAKGTGKAYGSVVVYLTKGTKAVKFLQEGYFYVGGESACVRSFEARIGPVRCYNCHRIGHKAFNCSFEGRCGNCAEEGHDTKYCEAMTPKCAVCNGLYSVSSLACPSRTNGY